MKSCLQIVAITQLGVAALNLFLPRILKWKEDIARMPLLLREVFHVHAWFISITLSIFGVMTWRFASEMAAGTNEALRWLDAGISVFWAIRAALQVVYYSSSHWRGLLLRSAIHVALLVLYGGFAACYLWAALGGGN